MRAPSMEPKYSGFLIVSEKGEKSEYFLEVVKPRYACRPFERATVDSSLNRSGILKRESLTDL